MNSDRAIPLRSTVRIRTLENTATHNPGIPRHKDSAPLGAGVKAKPYGSTYGRALTPTPRRRMPFTGPGNPQKIYKLPKARGLTRPHSFRNEWTPSLRSRYSLGGIYEASNARPGGRGYCGCSRGSRNRCFHDTRLRGSSMCTRSYLLLPECLVPRVDVRSDQYTDLR